MDLAILEHIIPVVALPFGQVNAEGNIPAARLPGCITDDLREMAPGWIAIHRTDDFRAWRHPHDRRGDQRRLLRVGRAADAGITRVLIGMECRIAQAIDRALREYQFVIVRLRVRTPQPLLAAIGEAGEVPVFDLVAAEPIRVEMRKHSIAAGVRPDTAGES